MNVENICVLRQIWYFCAYIAWSCENFFIKPNQFIKIGFSQIKLIIGFQFYCYFEYRLMKYTSDGVLIVFTRWFYNRPLSDVWTKITINNSIHLAEMLYL